MSFLPCWVVAAQPEVKPLLMDALLLDQKHRAAINQLKQSDENVQAKQLTLAQKQLDQVNKDTLNQVIEQLGHWPGVNDVGENTAKIALVLFNHTDLTQQQKYLPLMRAAVQQQNIPAVWYADAYDRHQVAMNKPQKYGQVLIKNNTSPTPRLYPLKSLQQTNKHRMELGLPSLKTALGGKNYLLRESLVEPDKATLFPAEQLMPMAQLALTCLDQPYPNSIKHVLSDATDAQPPDQLHPAFFGCFDWHSSVHGHWLLVRVAKLFPKHPDTPTILARLDNHFTAAKMNQELRYFQQAGRGGYERPYGLAWYLQLYSEIKSWKHPKAQQWLEHLTPLKNHIIHQYSHWIPKLAYPIRVGTHSQTAFAFGLSLDYARQSGDQGFEKMLTEHIKRLYLNDTKCPINYEPSGQDFLSPCLAEADLMRRVLPAKAFGRWLKKFLPGIKRGSQWLPVAVVTDRVDGKLAHLDGLNLARGWMLEGIASGLPQHDKRRKILAAVALTHAQSGLSAVTGEHYAGGHWLGSFAVYYLSQSGLP